MHYLGLCGGGCPGLHRSRGHARRTVYLRLGLTHRAAFHKAAVGVGAVHGVSVGAVLVGAIPKGMAYAALGNGIIASQAPGGPVGYRASVYGVVGGVVVIAHAVVSVLRVAYAAVYAAVDVAGHAAGGAVVTIVSVRTAVYSAHKTFAVAVAFVVFGHRPGGTARYRHHAGDGRGRQNFPILHIWYPPL
jgi:hypothetical protein